MEPSAIGFCWMVVAWMAIVAMAQSVFPCSRGAGLVVAIEGLRDQRENTTRWVRASSAEPSALVYFRSSYSGLLGF